MTDARPESDGGLPGSDAPATPTEGPPAAAPWNDFGVPHAGHHPEPSGPSPFERPPGGTSPTQPIQVDPWQRENAPGEHPVPGAAPWWSPSGESAGHGAPGAPGEPWRSGSAYPPQAPQPWDAAVAAHHGGASEPPRRRPHRAARVAGLAVLALVCGLIGGGAVVAGERYLQRGTSLGSALPAPGPGSTARPEGSIAKIAANALPSVVTIKIKSAQGSGTGSGFVIDRQGHILTNNHVVAAAGDTGTITVELNNGKTLPATVVGKDASYDLAVLKVDTLDLVPLEFGRSVDVVVGDGVIAVGAPLGLDATVTSGIVSALNRPVTPGDGSDQSFINAIQTDAAINPGNSGGPLLDMNGRVIGVNSAIARVPGSDAGTGGNIGVGFSIPSDQAAKTAQQLIATGKAEHPVLGVRVDRSFDGDGAKIAQDGGVAAGSPADKAGLKNGDVVVEFEGKKVTDADSLIVSIRSKSVGDNVTLVVQRNGQTVRISMTLQAASS